MYFKNKSNFADIQENFQFFENKPINWALLVILIVVLLILGYFLYKNLSKPKEKFGYKFY